MCGITGIASSTGIGELDIEPMMARIAHRGPDDAGTWTSGDRRVVLGHRRLSIIDLSAAGHEPMTEESRRLWMTFNGEIYNFRELRAELESLGYTFRTQTDGEVILYAYRRWGVRCVERFNGMFAFAIYDEDAEKLFIARDRIGKKPLFYAHQGTTFLFGSEVKAITASRGADWPLDPQAVNAYFAFGYIPGERSIFAGIRRLLPGHRMTYDLRRNAVSIDAYWTPDAAVGAMEVEDDLDTLVNELDELLSDSVRLRMIADVPLGVLLSGGIDSSLITAMAARRSSRPVKTFTVTFPGGGAYDESSHARMVAEHFGTEHYELPLPHADFEVMRGLAHQLDEPLADPSVLPTYLVSKLTRSHVTVALGGDGGDELFGGYAWYRRGMQVEKTLARVPGVVRRAAAAAAGWLPAGVRGRNFVRGHAADLCHFMITESTQFDTGLRARLLRAEVREQIGDLERPEIEKSAHWRRDADGMLQMSLLDLHTYLPDDILIKVDRASMAVALEMRAPFLDYRIIEFALGRVPSHLKVSETGSRFVQRELARRLLPPELELERKQGFVMPINQWLQGSWGDAGIEAVETTEAREWIDPNVAKELLAGQRKGRTNGVRLFNLLMFALWLEGARKVEPAAMQCGAVA